MKPTVRTYSRRACTLGALAATALSLSGCIVAVPPALQVASLALDGISYMTTGKSVTDHAISTVTAQDCAMTRALKGDDICTRTKPQLAMLPDGSPVPYAGDAVADITPAREDANFQSFARTQPGTADQDLDEILSSAEIDDFDMMTASGPVEPIL